MTKTALTTGVTVTPQREFMPINGFAGIPGGRHTHVDVGDDARTGAAGLDASRGRSTPHTAILDAPMRA